MRVLQVNTTCNRGSTGKIAVRINQALVENGHEGIVAYGHGESDYIHSYKVGGKVNYYFHNIMSRIFGHEGFYSIAATRKFLKWVEKYKPDIIHLHNLHGHYINIKLLFEYIKKKSIKTIWTLHDCWSFTGKCTYFDAIDCDKWKSQCKKCPQLKEYPASIIDTSNKDYKYKREVTNGIENLAIITPSNWLSGLVHQSFLRNYEIKVINNGIDTTVFKPTHLKDKELLSAMKEKFVILGVASPWSKRKGFNDFIMVAKQFIENNDIIFLMVGLSKKQIERLPSNVIGIKRTDSVSILAQIYTRANVFLNPTYEDNYPTVNLEAIACGTPVITYDTGGSGEIVLNTSGYVVEKGNLILIERLIKDMALHNSKTQSTKNSLDEKNNIDKFNRKYFQAYQLLCEGKGIK